MNRTRPNARNRPYGEGLRWLSAAVTGVGLLAIVLVPMASSEPRIVVDRPDALVDTPLSIRLVGFAPHRPIL